MATTPHNNPHTKNRAPGVSATTGQVRSVPEQMQAGQLTAAGHTRLGAQLDAGQIGQLGVAQMVRAVDTPLASSGTISGTMCARYIGTQNELAI